MSTYVIAYISALVVFLGIDFIWLKYVAFGFYRSQIGDLLLDKPNLSVAAVFYLFYVVGVIVLAVMPALREGSWTTAALYGAVLGFAAYGTYDFTNLATLKGWSVPVSLMDTAWGTVLTATTATASYFITRALQS